LVLKNAMASFNELPKLEKHTFSVLTHYDKLDQHPNPDNMKKGLERRPTRFIKEAPCARRENESIPGSDSKSADKEILVSTEMWRQVQRGRQELTDTFTL